MLMHQIFKFVQLTTDFFGRISLRGILVLHILFLPGDDSTAGAPLPLQQLDIIHSCIACFTLDRQDDCCDPVIRRVLREEVTKR